MKLTDFKQSNVHQMNGIDSDIKSLTADLNYQQQRLAEAQKEKYAALTRRGMVMLHLPDSNIKLILPIHMADDLARCVQFVISEDSTDQNATGVLTPFAGQLNVTYFTGD